MRGLFRYHYQQKGLNIMAIAFCIILAVSFAPVFADMVADIVR